MEREDVFKLTGDCFSGQPASCTYACPFRLDLRSVIKKMARGRWNAAYKDLQTATLFPALVCSLCPHPCEDACQRKRVLGEAPVAVGLLEQACLQFADKKAAVRYVLPPKEGKVAIVGAGPAGLSCALRLAQKQFHVTVFDRNSGWGGSLRTHPQFAEFDQDFQLQFSAVEIQFVFRFQLDSLSQLSEYRAIYLATGRDGEHFGLLDGLDARLFATKDPRVFLGGEVAGVALIEGMGCASAAARAIEAFLLSGSPAFSAENWDRSNARRFAPHLDEPPKPAVLFPDTAYTQDDAVAEAGRCMLCDCNACMDACELLEKYRKKPPRIASDVHQDGQGGRNSVSKANITRQTWSCNLCGRCGSRCAQSVDLAQAFQLSRVNRVDNGYYPPAFHAYWMREMNYLSGEAAFSGVFEGKTCGGYAFFPGCSMEQTDPDTVIRVYAYLHDRLQAGLILNCCGIPAYWAGQDDRFQGQLNVLRQIWEEQGKPVLILACASCARTFNRFLPEIPTVSIYEILVRYGVTSAAMIPFSRAAVFDPCAAGNYPEWRDAVRALAADSGIAQTDYASDGKCCGFGGHMQLADRALYRRITESRSQDTTEPYVVYCANCQNVFAGRGKACAHILNILFGLESGGVPTLEEKKENCLMLKQRMMNEYWNAAFTPAVRACSELNVAVMPEILAKMEEQLISLSDVKETIQRAELRQEGFVNGQGEVLCRMVCPVITYWVLYRQETDDAGQPIYVVLDVYSHRMHIRGEEE